jgi:hypothetical protein
MTNRLAMLACAAALLVGITGQGRAAMEPVADACPGSQSVCIWHRPVVTAPAGWQRAEAASTHYQAAAFAPVGQEFNTAPAVMYAKAVAASPQVRTLSDFMADDLSDFRRQYPGLRVQQGLVTRDGDGHGLATVRLSPAPGGRAQWQTIAYGQEGGDYLVFSLSARDQAAHDAALPAFMRLVGAYHAAPAMPARKGR